jgi:hypothetical protein
MEAVQDIHEGQRGVGAGDVLHVDVSDSAIK